MPGMICIYSIPPIYALDIDAQIRTCCTLSEALCKF
jgi:hypothetical protein